VLDEPTEHDTCLGGHDARLGETNLRGGQARLAFAQHALGDTRVGSPLCRCLLLRTSRAPCRRGHFHRPPCFLEVAPGDHASLGLSLHRSKQGFRLTTSRAADSLA
jgi:hypothetical protein